MTKKRQYTTQKHVKKLFDSAINKSALKEATQHADFMQVINKIRL